MLLSRPCNSDNQPFERLVEKAIEQNRDDDDNEKKLADAERLNTLSNLKREGEINKMDMKHLLILKNTAPLSYRTEHDVRSLSPKL